MRVYIMPRVTVSVSEEDKQYLKEKSGDSGEYESMSAVMRDCISAHKRVDELETEVERLQNEKQTLIQDRQERSQLVEYVEEEQTYRQASLPTRAKWWLFGKPDESDSE
jgi:Arc/MetJ-type ribon-helix-helix transcriptional regulator